MTVKCTIHDCRGFDHEGEVVVTNRYSGILCKQVKVEVNGQTVVVDGDDLIKASVNAMNA